MPTQLLTLPPEIIDEILSYISLIPHLLSFALTSHDSYRHVVPRHTEYRFLQTTFPRYSTWVHLAQHTLLARNIRHVYLFDRNVGNPFLDRFPKSPLVVQPGPDFDEKSTDAEFRYMRAVALALLSMDLLETFVWSTKSPPKYPTLDFAWEFTILDLLLKKQKTLRRVYLSGGFARYSPLVRGDSKSIKYPGWRFRDLTTLCLHGPEWFTPNNAPHLFHLLENNPHLEHLDIPMEFTLLSSPKLSFPALKKLKLTLTSGAPMFIDRIHISFLERHESIEDLYWYPIGNGLQLPKGKKFLPSLKRLSSDISFVQALVESCSAQDDDERTLEALDIRSLPSTIAQSLSSSHHPLISLKTLTIHTVHHTDPVNLLPTLFPSLAHLHLPSAATGSNYERMVFTVDGWVGLLSGFATLQVLRGSGVWETLRQVQMSQGGSGREAVWKESMERIVRACPTLKELDDWKRDEEVGEFMRLVIKREEVPSDEKGSEERISYHLRRPKPVSVFDLFSGAFD